MNKQRRDRIDRVIQEGYAAFLNKKTVEDCPYRQDGEWSLGGYWTMGWSSARTENIPANNKPKMSLREKYEALLAAR